MIYSPMRTLRKRTIELSTPIIVIASLVAVFVGESSHAAAAMTWVGLGPQLGPTDYEGHLGGQLQQQCNCNKDGDNQNCPDNGGGGSCTLTYHSCYTSTGGTDNHYCVGSGNASYCGGSSCKTTQYSTCVGTCLGSP